MPSVVSLTSWYQKCGSALLLSNVSHAVGLFSRSGRLVIQAGLGAAGTACVFGFTGMVACYGLSERIQTPHEQLTKRYADFVRCFLLASKACVCAHSAGLRSDSAAASRSRTHHRFCCRVACLVLFERPQIVHRQLPRQRADEGPPLPDRQQSLRFVSYIQARTQGGPQPCHQRLCYFLLPA